VTDQATRVVPAGWYEDPASRAHVRWWNGLAWTEHTALKPAAQPPQPVAHTGYGQQGSGQQGAAQQGYGQGYRQQGSEVTSTGSTQAADTAARIAEARELERQYGISTAEHDIIMRRAAEGTGSTDIAGADPSGSSQSGSSQSGYVQSGYVQSGYDETVGSTRHAWSAHDGEPEYADQGTGTVSAWFIALWPILTLVAIAAAGYIAYFITPEPAVAGIPLVFGLALAPLLLTLVWAATDVHRLRSLGHEAPSPALALLGPLVYLIARRTKVAGVGPLVTLIVLTLVAVGIPAAAIVTGAAERVTFALEVQQTVRTEYVDSGELTSVSCPLLVDSIAPGSLYTCDGILPNGSDKLVWVSIDGADGEFSTALAVR